MPFWYKSRVTTSPVLVADALGFSTRIEKCHDREALADLASILDDHFHAFMSKVPYRCMFVGKNRVFGTRDFSSLRLNDMFVLFSQTSIKDLPMRYLVAASLVYHQLLLRGLIVRGGLGFGMVIRNKDFFIGRGFLDAYRVAEKRNSSIRDVCAIAVSPSFFRHVVKQERCCRLLCLYEDHYFLHPTALTDPDMGEFDNVRILRCLADAGADEEKLSATEHFLANLEDYDAALEIGSRSRKLTGWMPSEQGVIDSDHTNTVDGLGEAEFRDWPEVWCELARLRGVTYTPSRKKWND